MTRHRALGRASLFLVIALHGAGAAHTQILTTGHLDLEFRYGPGGWDVVVDHDNFPDLSTDKAVLAAIDQPFPGQGNRAARPAAGQWDFLGVGAGEPLWLFPQATTPLLWPGWAAEGAFAEYFEPDPRLGFTAPFLRVGLEAIRYEGSGDGHFSVWTNQTGGGLTVWIASADGISPDDAFFFSSGHSHANLGFSDLGVYQVDLEASGFLDNDGESPPAGTNPVASGTRTITFAIGTFAEWKARFYPTADLVDQNASDAIPAVSHPLSDTDHDGVPLLLEYAFGLSPTVADHRPAAAGAPMRGLPLIRAEGTPGNEVVVLSYPRRRAETNPQLTYHPEFSSDPDLGWSEAGDEMVTPIDAEWEWVEVRDPVGPGAGPFRLGRVRIELE